MTKLELEIAERIAHSINEGARRPIRYVFLASPYTRPNPNHNTNASLKVADELIKLGFAPFVPLLTHFWDTVSPRSYEEWLLYDQAWLERCDVVLRFDGESPGADKEVAYARSKDIPVVYSIAELLRLAMIITPAQRSRLQAFDMAEPIFYLAQSIEEYYELGGQDDPCAPGLRSLRCMADGIDRETGMVDLTVLLDLANRRGRTLRRVPFENPTGSWPAFAGDTGGSWHFLTSCP